MFFTLMELNILCDFLYRNLFEQLIEYACRKYTLFCFYLVNSKKDSLPDFPHVAKKWFMHNQISKNYKWNSIAQVYK